MAGDMKPSVRVKRLYEAPSASDGLRILVDRVWPRGVSKDDLQLDAWLRDMAPGSELRRWFNHEPSKWDEFRKRYYRELDAQPEAVTGLLKKVGVGPVTLVFGAKDISRNNAVALKEYLEQRMEHE